MSDIEQVCDRIVIINRGEIVFDGSIREVNRINGHMKQIRVVFNGPWTAEQLEKLGHLREIKGDEVLLEIEPDQAPAVASHLFSNFPVQDIAITEPPLERVIESIYATKPVNTAD
jgi:ABC-2 type transport system ATP-binding protein